MMKNRMHHFNCIWLIKIHCEKLCTKRYVRFEVSLPMRNGMTFSEWALNRMKMRKIRYNKTYNFGELFEKALLVNSL